MEKHILSKSTFIKGYHCLKSLYLYKKRPFLRDKLTAEQRAKFKRGHKVGDMAQQLFPGGIDVSPKSPSQYQKSVVQTADLIAQGQEVIYEATFQFEKVLVMLDILVKTEQGWMAYEVKSSKGLSETYFTDAALQYYVIENSGLKLEKFYLVYVDQDYRLQSKMELNKYFIMQDVTSDIRDRQDFIAEKIQEEMELLQADHSPKVAVGAHCFAPYKCDFVGFCWKKLANKPYIPGSIKTPLWDGKPSLTTALSLMFSEQAIPECENEKAYYPKCIGYKIGEGEAFISGKSCEEKSEFIHSFFKEIESDKKYFCYDLSLMKLWLGELAILYPEYASQIEILLKNTAGILEVLEESGQIQQANKTIYSLAHLAKDVLKDDALATSAIYSDILAAELFASMEDNLWTQDSPDLHSLQNYLEQKSKIISELFVKF